MESDISGQVSTLFISRPRHVSYGVLFAPFLAILNKRDILELEIQAVMHRWSAGLTDSHLSSKLPSTQVFYLAKIATVFILRDRNRLPGESDVGSSRKDKQKLESIFGAGSYRVIHIIQ